MQLSSEAERLSSYGFIDNFIDNSFVRKWVNFIVIKNKSSNLLRLEKNLIVTESYLRQMFQAKTYKTHMGYIDCKFK